MSIEMLWFNPSRQLSTTQVLLMGQGKRKGRVKARKVVGWDKYCLICEGEKERKKTQLNKQGKGICLPHPTGRPMPSQFLSRIWLTPSNPLLFLLPAEHDFTWHGIPLWIVQVICLVVSPPNSLCTPPSLFTGGGQSEKQKNPGSCASTVQQQLKH